MSKELFASNLSSLINHLTTRSEIEFICYNVRDYKEKKYINYTIICDVASVVENAELLRSIVANMELIRTLYSRTNILFNYSIKTSRAFEEDLVNNKEKMLHEISNSEIVYSNDEYLENYLIDYDDEIKSRH